MRVELCAGTTMNVAQWLNAIDLGQYEALFREHEIDAGVLPDLVEADLEKIGVPLGHRKRLLRAIVGLSAGEMPPPAAKPPSILSSSPQPTLGADAERRPITVMFCDLVGSTSMAAKLDAEDWRTLVNTYLDEASAAVTGLGGHVLKKLGDGLMALFGYPHAQENDAERAVLAALAIQRALVEINARNASTGAPELQARIGLDSGQVVVDATGEVFGDAPNIAARVQSAGGAGSILITATVQRQTAGLFVAEDRGQHELKGVSAPMTLYRVVRASGGGRRGGARALTPLVGREEELDLLTRRWDRARKGEGQLALIVGEPGLGKSRLMEEFHGRLGETPYTWVEWSSSQLLQNTPLHPIAEWGRQRFSADLPAEQRLADLENTLGLIGLDATEYAPLLAPLVDVPLPEDRVAKLAPEELRRQQLAAMTAWILTAARAQAVVLAFEDLHWADPTSLDLIRALAERGAQASLLIIATTRPEFRPTWSSRSHHSVLSLSPLDRVQVAKMVGGLSARHALPRDIVERVNERTGGVPLFVEEVTRLLLERGEHGGTQAIPPTLQQSLAARLDRLGSARETAQIGAVLGRGFSYALLRSVAGLDAGMLQSALERLAEADILFVEGEGVQVVYRFKHALIQDAAYDSLLKSRRQALHRRAAEVLRDQPERAAAGPEVVAHHFTQAGLDDLAVEWWGKAGDQALRRSAFQEAIAHLGKAIAMADKAGRISSQAQKMHVAYGNALIAARGYGAPETTEAFERAGESAFGDKDAPGRLAADYGRWAGSYVRGELSAMRAHAETFFADVQARSDQPEAGVARRVAGVTHWFAGEYVEARETLEYALALFQPGRDDDLAFRFGHDEGVAAMLYLALTLWPLGDVGRAVSLVGDAEARMAGLAHIGSHANHRALAVVFELMRHDTSRAAMNGVELAQLAREHDLPFWRAFAVFLEGLAASQGSTASGGLEAMRRGIELVREQNVLLFDGLVKIAFAEAEARAGDPERAVASLDEALATCERIGHRTFEAELHRVRGEMLLKRDPAKTASAEEALQTAIAVAQRQGTRSFELRAALALAKLYQSTGSPAEAHAVLAPALDGFSPTPEMPEIAEAEALLEALTETEEVGAAAARRERRVKIQTAFGQALMWTKGFASQEAKEAFARLREMSGGRDDSERFPPYYAQFVRSCMRAEWSQARGTAEAFLREAEDRGCATEACAARRCLGTACLFQGDLREAQALLEQALADYAPHRDALARFRFAFDTGVLAAAHLALAMWRLGEVVRACQLAKQAIQRAAELGHAPTSAAVYTLAALLDTERDDPGAVLRSAEIAHALGLEHGMDPYVAEGGAFAGWARGRLHDPAVGAQEFRQALADYFNQGNKAVSPLFHGMLAQLEAATRGPDAALTLVNEGLAIAAETGERFTDAYLHRLRGDILLKGDPANPAPAEEAFKTAISVAKEQGGRSYELLASLSLAKLYRSNGRRADANAVLAPALTGFSPTPEMPEIAEAQTLLAALAANEPDTPDPPQ
jgi:class 3 adenylate cyclase/predicted ATPase